MCIYRIVLINKGIEDQCTFCIAPENGPAVLRMPGCEQLQLMSMSCQMTNDLDNRAEIRNQHQINIKNTPRV